MPFLCFAYFSTMKKEAIYASETLTSNELHVVMSQNIGLFINIMTLLIVKKIKLPNFVNEFSNETRFKTKTKPRGLSHRQSDRLLSAKLLPTFPDRGCRVVSATDPHGRIIGYLDRRRYFFFQAAPQLYSRG
jgi:hypothetical protein